MNFLEINFKIMKKIKIFYEKNINFLKKIFDHFLNPNFIFLKKIDSYSLDDL